VCRSESRCRRFVAIGRPAVTDVVHHPADTGQCDQPLDDSRCRLESHAVDSPQHAHVTGLIDFLGQQGVDVALIAFRQSLESRDHVTPPVLPVQTADLGHQFVPCGELLHHHDDRYVVVRIGVDQCFL
jgi:hypothetical protein